MKKLQLIALVGAMCMVQAVQSASVRFFNKTEPKKPIWVGLEPGKLKKIETSQIFDTGPSKGVTNAYWSYSEGGQVNELGLNWGPITIGRVEIYNDRGEATVFYLKQWIQDAIKWVQGAVETGKQTYEQGKGIYEKGKSTAGGFTSGSTTETGSQAKAPGETTGTSSAPTASAPR